MAKSSSELTLRYLQRQPRSAARVLEVMEIDVAASYLSGVPAQLAAPVLEAMAPGLVARLFVSQQGRKMGQYLLPLMSPWSAANVLRRMPLEHRDHLLENLAATTVFRLKLLLRYPVGVVGAWMDTEAIFLPVDIQVGAAWERFRRAATMLDRFIPVVDAGQKFAGVIATSDLLTASENTPLERLLQSSETVIQARMSLEEAIRHPAWQTFDVLPVVSREGLLLGVVHYAKLHKQLEAGAQEQLQDNVFTDTLLDLVEAYWIGLMRLVDGSVSILPLPDSHSKQREEEKLGKDS